MCAANNLWRRLATCEKSVAKQSGLQRIQGTLSPPQTKGHLIIFTWLIWLIPSPPPPRKTSFNCPAFSVPQSFTCHIRKVYYLRPTFFQVGLCPPGLPPPHFQLNPGSAGAAPRAPDSIICYQTVLISRFTNPH